MTTEQSEVGRIRIFEDFIGEEWIATNVDETPHVGQFFRIVGDTIADTDAGFVSQEADPTLNGVVRFTTPNGTDNDGIGLSTGLMFDVALMGMLVAECRVQFADLDTKEFYFGFSSENADDQTLEGDLIHGGASTITLTASHICGFLYSSETTEAVDWYMVYNGGTTTGQTDASEINAGVTPVAAEYNILRVEVDNNGTARWYVDGVLKQTVSGAVSKTANLACLAILEIKSTGTVETCDVDYILVEANRDWTV